MSRKQSKESPSPPKTLRERAEEVLPAAPTDVTEMAAEDLQRLVHELQVHQMELELQNEELRLAQVELAEARDRYADLYEFAPVGYVTLNREGTILEGNLTAAKMLGVERRSLLRSNLSQFVARASQDEWYLHRQSVFLAETKQSCEIEMHRADGGIFSVRLECFAFGANDDRRCRTALVDVTEKKRADEVQALNVELEERVDERTLELAAHERRLKLAQEAARIGVWEWDLEGGALFWDAIEFELFGIDPTTRITTETFFNVLHPDDVAEQKRLAKEAETGAEYDTEFRIVRPDGTTRWLAGKGELVRDDNNKPLRILGINFDITGRKRAEQALRESAERMQAIVNTAADAIITIDTKGMLESFNPAAEQMFGYTREEAIGKNVVLLMPSPYREEHDGYIDRYLKTGEACIIGIGREVEARRKDGTTFPIELAVGEVGHLGLFTGFIRDITERKRSEHALTASEKRLRALSSSLLHAQEEERRALSRELHDELGHQLTLLGMEVDGLELPSDATKLKLKELVEELAHNMRTLSHRIHPSALDHLGLIAALRRECEGVAKSSRKAIEFRAADEVPRRPPPPVAMCLYRVAQEALRNASKHSGSDRIAVSLVSMDAGLHLSIRDWGNGFEMRADRSDWGLGLVSMEERVRLVDGQFHLESTPGKGTTVSCWAPLPGERDIE